VQELDWHLAEHQERAHCEHDKLRMADPSVRIPTVCSLCILLIKDRGIRATTLVEMSWHARKDLFPVYDRAVLKLNGMLVMAGTPALLCFASRPA
jgi:hypothetical protein